MRKILGAFLGFLFVGSVCATEIAVLDFRAALLQSNIGQEAAKEPKSKVAEMDARLKQEQVDLETLAKNLKRDELTLSEDDFKTRRRALAEQQNKIRSMAASMQRQAKELEQQLIQALTPKGELALKSLIEEQKLDLVLNRQLSLYAGSGVDITNELIKRINQDN